MSTKVQTVLGDVDPSVLGRTLTHEHLAMEFSHFYREPPSEIAIQFQSGFTLQNISTDEHEVHLMVGDTSATEHQSMMRCRPTFYFEHLEIHRLKPKRAICTSRACSTERSNKPVRYLTNYGTIVENTTVGIKRDIDFYKQVSEKTKVHVVAGTGHYIADVQNNDIIASSTEDLYNHMLKELTEGCVDYPTVKAGFMGEIASVWPIKDFERKAIKAAGEVQSEIGCGVSFHPHRDPEAPFEIIRLYAEAGGKVDKAVMSHLDRTLLDFDKLSQFAELGTYCQFDLFGVEVSYYQLNITTDMPSDAQRLDLVRKLVDEGKVDRILMSHDIHTKHRLIDFGGHGYCHIINNILPRMRAKGFTDEQIDKIIIENPAKWLSFI